MGTYCLYFMVVQSKNTEGLKTLSAVVSEVKGKLNVRTKALCPI